MKNGSFYFGSFATQDSTDAEDDEESSDLTQQKPNKRQKTEELDINFDLSSDNLLFQDSKLIHYDSFYYTDLTFNVMIICRICRYDSQLRLLHY